MLNRILTTVSLVVITGAASADMVNATAITCTNAQPGSLLGDAEVTVRLNKETGSFEIHYTGLDETEPITMQITEFEDNGRRYEATRCQSVEGTTGRQVFRSNSRSLGSNRSESHLVSINTQTSDAVYCNFAGDSVSTKILSCKIEN